MDIGAAWSSLSSSPLAVALVSVLGVKLADILYARGKDKQSRDDKSETNLWARIEKLEDRAIVAERRNDDLILENAKLNARIAVAEAQNAMSVNAIAQAQQQAAAQQAELLKVTLERDTLKEKVNELERRIKDLERKEH